MFSVLNKALPPILCLIGESILFGAGKVAMSHVKADHACVDMLPSSNTMKGRDLMRRNRGQTHPPNGDRTLKAWASPTGCTS